VDVPPERLARWAEGFAERHGPVVVESADALTLTAADGAVAQLHPPFPPVPAAGEDPLQALVEHAARPRRLGVLLVRLGGYAAGIFEGDRLVASKVDTRLVHGRQRNGGSSQKRYARRRENEVSQLADAAAAVAARVLLPQLDTLDAVFLGGDRRTVDLALAADKRLEPLAAKVVEPFLTVPDPRFDILAATPAKFRAVRIRITDPAE
jgi:hypothetical protein